mgnify:CR=1 FL=1
MKNKLSRDIKRNFKNDVFTNLIKKDIEKYGKGMHSINSAYIGIEWALNQNEEIKTLIENNGYEKGFQDAIEKAKQIIISFMPLPSPNNHNINSDVELLKERQEYAKQIAVKFEEMMNADEKGIC